MALSKVEITFNSIPNVNDFLSIGNSLSGVTIQETFVTFRYTINQTTIGVDTNSSAYLYVVATDLDYGSTGLYTITVIDNVVTTPTNIINAIIKPNRL